MPTLLTDPRSGGVKKSSGVKVLPIIKETWAEVRDETNTSVDWIIAEYDGTSKTCVTLLKKGNGGIEECSANLPENKAVFGGVRLKYNSRFVTFIYASPGTPIMQKGRASMQKNGVFNVLEGSDCEIDVRPNMTEEEIELPLIHDDKLNHGNNSASVTMQSFKAEANSKHTKSSNSDRLNEKNNAAPTTIQASKVEKNARLTKPSKSDMSTETREIVIDEPEISSESQPQDPAYVNYSIIKGVSNPADLPKGVDPLNKEQSLTREEFEEVFGLSKTEFTALPEWKRKSLKKAKQLF